MDTSVQDIIIGNTQGARGPYTDTKPRDDKCTLQCIVYTPVSAARPSPKQMKFWRSKKDRKSDAATEECAAVQTRAMAANEKKPPKAPLKFNSVLGSDVGPEEIKAKQKEDDSILYRKYSGKKEN